MSFADQSADGAQPQEGQGGDGTDAPYAEYLERIPEEARGEAEEAFKAWDADTTRKFQEHADFRKNWEPYEQIGVNQLSPEQLQWGMQFMEALENPEAIREWYGQYAQQNGLAEQFGNDQQQGDEFAFVDPNQQQMEQLLEGKLGPLLQRFEQYDQQWQQLEQNAHEAQIEGQLEQAVQELKAKEAENLPSELRDQFDSLIERFAMQYAEPGADPRQVISRGWQDLQTYINAVEKSVLQGKVDAPKPAEGGGVPDVNPPQYKRIQDVQDAAKEFLRNNNRA